MATMGLLRVSAPVDFGVRHVSPVCASFAKENSGISLDLVLTDRPVDLVEERVDVCIRYGDLRHPAAVVHKLVAHGGEERSIMSACRPQGRTKRSTHIL